MKEFLRSAVFALFTLAVLMGAVVTYYTLRDMGAVAAWAGVLILIGGAGAVYVFWPGRK